MIRTTAGQLVVNAALPEDLRDNNRILDKKSLHKLLQEVAEKYPDQYRDIAHKLSRIGYHVAYFSGGQSFGLEHMRTSLAGKASQMRLRKKISQIYTTPEISDEEKETRVVEELLKEKEPLQEAILKESIAERNPLAMQVLSGSRGNAGNLRSLRGSDLLYVDHHDRPIPIPILKNYSQGLSPAEYFAGSFGTRKGVADVKFATQDAGFFSKQLNQLSHRLIVTSRDRDKDPDFITGMPVDTDDSDNEGALLASSAGGYTRNTVLTPKILSTLREKGIKRILVRSPIAGGPEDGGIYASDLGIREKGKIPPIGDYVGIAAAQALSEPLMQGQLSSKHSGGVAGAAKSVTGFKLVNQLVQVPKTFKGGAAHAQVDGKVQSIEKASQGGNFVWINGSKHYVGTGYGVLVKKGDTIEAGDVISEGIPNPSEIVKFKGIGEGRRYFVDAFRRAYKDAEMPVNRRNIEIMSRGLIDHVRLTDEMEDYVPGDTVPYSRLEHFYQPRTGFTLLDPKRAQGMYLEKPVMHYSIGTKIRPSVMRNLSEFGVNNIAVHSEPPPFQSEMIRGMENLAHDPDWMTRFMGSYLEKNLLKGVHRGDVSEEQGTSFVPSLARGANFGIEGKTVGYKLETSKSILRPI